MNKKSNRSAWIVRIVALVCAALMLGSVFAVAIFAGK